MSIIEVKDVSYAYDTAEAGEGALRGVSLTVEKGEFVCILGHNGSGKSTLAKLLNGLFLPNSGTVRIDGTETAGHELEVRRKAGMVFQNPDNQMVASVVEEDVAFGPENLGVEQSLLATRVQEALDAVGMGAFAKSAPHHLSGGQKQRVAIAGVLAMEPEILIMDEPTAMLDPQGRQEVLATVRRLNREKGITVVYITHFMEETVEADRLIVMHEGQIAMQGTPREIFRKESEIRRLTLEVPPVTAIARRLQESGFLEQGQILTMEELTDAVWQSLQKT